MQVLLSLLGCCSVPSSGGVYLTFTVSTFPSALSHRCAAGRRRVFLLTIFNTFLFGALSASAPNYGLYIVCRVLLGFGIGGQGPVSIALLLEFTPSYCRGFASGLVWVGWCADVLQCTPLRCSAQVCWGSPRDSYWVLPGVGRRWLGLGLGLGISLGAD